MDFRNAEIMKIRFVSTFISAFRIPHSIQVSSPPKPDLPSNHHTNLNGAIQFYPAISATSQPATDHSFLLTSDCIDNIINTISYVKMKQTDYYDA